MGKWIVGLAALVALAPTAVRADETAEAKRLYDSATKHFDLGEYEAALNDFKEGFRHKDDPVFLYNIAQCYRLMKGHEEDALKFYKSYLRRQPDAVNRAEVETKIETLEKALALQEKARTTPPSATIRPGELPPASAPGAQPAPAATVAAAPAPTPERTPVYKKWWLWTAVGAVVVVGAGVGLGVGLAESSKPAGTAFPGVTF